MSSVGKKLYGPGTDNPAVPDVSPISLEQAKLGQQFGETLEGARERLAKMPEAERIRHLKELKAQNDAFHKELGDK